MKRFIAGYVCASLIVLIAADVLGPAKWGDAGCEPQQNCSRDRFVTRIDGQCVCVELAKGSEPVFVPVIDPDLGNVDGPCKPDGTCNGDALECVPPKLYLGIPMRAGSCCLPRKR